jgi:hypothetical protein
VTAVGRPRFKLTPPPIAEDELHIAVADALRVLILPPAQWTTFPAGVGELPPQTAARLYRKGLAPGWPDILVVHRRLYGIELKAPGGELTRTLHIVRPRSGRVVERMGQRERFPLLEGAGMTIAVCLSVVEVVGQLHHWGIPMRRAAA